MTETRRRARDTVKTADSLRAKKKTRDAFTLCRSAEVSRRSFFARRFSRFSRLRRACLARRDLNPREAGKNLTVCLEILNDRASRPARAHTRAPFDVAATPALWSRLDRRISRTKARADPLVPRPSTNANLFGRSERLHKTARRFARTASGESPCPRTRRTPRRTSPTSTWTSLTRTSPHLRYVPRIRRVRATSASRAPRPPRLLRGKRAPPARGRSFKLSLSSSRERRG